MTDHTHPPPPSEPPYTSPAASNPYAAPANPNASPASPYAATGPKPKQGLSLTSFILGIAGFILSWIPFLGLLVSIGAVVLGFIAMSRQKSATKWMWIVGLVAGFLGLLGGLIWTILTIAVIATANTSYSTY